MSLSLFSPAKHEVGGSSLVSLISVFAVKSSHLALRMFWYVWLGSVGGSGNQPANLMVIGRWSDFNVVTGFQTEPSDRWGVTFVRSGEEEVPS